MVVIYFTVLDDLSAQADFKRNFRLLPEHMQEEIRPFRLRQEQKLRLAGRLLLQKLIRYFKRPFTLNDLKYTAYGRPFFDGDFSFNISHSGDIVVCAAKEKGWIGIDIEKMTLVNMEEFADYFSEQEWKYIYGSADKHLTFFEMWTKKESFLKAAGMEIHCPLQEIEILDKTIVYNNKTYYFKRVNIHDQYPSWIVCDEEIGEVIVKEMPESFLV